MISYAGRPAARKRMLTRREKRRREESQTESKRECWRERERTEICNCSEHPTKRQSNHTRATTQARHAPMAASHTFSCPFRSLLGFLRSRQQRPLQRRRRCAEDRRTPPPRSAAPWRAPAWSTQAALPFCNATERRACHAPRRAAGPRAPRHASCGERAQAAWAASRSHSRASASHWPKVSTEKGTSRPPESSQAG